MLIFPENIEPDFIPFQHSLYNLCHVQSFAFHVHVSVTGNSEAIDGQEDVTHLENIRTRGLFIHV